MSKTKAARLNNLLNGLARSGAMLSTSLMYGCATFLTKMGPSSDNFETGPVDPDAKAIGLSDMKVSIAPKPADVQPQSGRLAAPHSLSGLQSVAPTNTSTVPALDTSPITPSAVTPDVPKVTPPSTTPLVTPAPALSGAGDSTAVGGGGGASAPPPLADVSISGKAINGYLSNALVFQDKNKNFALDLNEAVGITNANGDYSLTGKLEGSLIVKSIAKADISELIIAANRLGLTQVVTAIQEGTSYVDSKTGLRVSYTGSMSAPIMDAKTNITPLTTLVAAEMQAGKSYSESSQLVQKVFGVTPGTDYVALATAETAGSSQYKNLQSYATAISQYQQLSTSYFGSNLTVLDISEALADELATALSKQPNSMYSVQDVAGLVVNDGVLSDALYSVLSKSGEIDNTKIQEFRILLDQKLSNINVANTSPVYLMNDSGVSSIDHVTNQAALSGSILSGDGKVQYKLFKLDDKTPATLANVQDWATGTKADLREGKLDGLLDGSWRIFVKGFDSNSAAYLDFTFDSLAPTVQANADHLLAVDSAPSNVASGLMDSVTNNLSLSQAVQDALKHAAAAENLQVQYSVSRAGTAVANGTWLSFYNKPTSSDEKVEQEDVTLSYRFVDQAGNAGQTNSFSYKFDTHAPVIDLNTFKLSEDTGRLANDAISKKIDINLSGLVAAQRHEMIEYVILPTATQLDDKLFSTNQANPTHDGAYKVWMRSVDQAGNYSDIKSASITLDTVAPALLNTDLLKSNSADVVNSQSDGSTLINTNYLYTNAQDNSDGYVQYLVQNTHMGEVASWSYAIDVTDGMNYNLLVRRVDAAGNVSDEKSVGEFLSHMSRPGNISRDTALDLLAQYKSTLHSDASTVVTYGDGGNQTAVIADRVTHISNDLTVHQFSVHNTDLYGNSSIAQIFTEVSKAGSEMYSPIVMVDDPAAFTTYANKPAVFNAELDSAVGPIDYKILGSSAGDIATNINAGDIFIGQGGGDIVVLDKATEVLGVGFVNSGDSPAYASLYSDLKTYQKSLPDIVPSSAQHATALPLSINEDGLQANVSALDATLIDVNSSSPPSLKLFLRTPYTDVTDEGITIIQSDVIVSDRKSDNQTAVYFFTTSKTGVPILHLSDGAESLFIDGKGVVVDSGAGSDEIHGGSSADILITGPSDGKGADVIHGGKGDDVLIASDFGLNSFSKSFLFGEGGDDSFLVTNGDVTIDVGDGTNNIFVQPLKSDVSNVIDINAFNLSTDDVITLLGLRSDAKQGLVTNFANGVLSVDLTHAYQNYSHTQVGMGSQLNISLSAESLSGSDEDISTLLSMLLIDQNEIPLVDLLS